MGVGKDLLHNVAKAADTHWGAIYMRLAVYHDNLRARAFYDDLGFDPIDGETTLVLADQAFQNMRGRE